jgi:hypothetical protein
MYHKLNDNLSPTLFSDLAPVFLFNGTAAPTEAVNWLFNILSNKNVNNKLLFILALTLLFLVC